MDAPDPPGGKLRWEYALPVRYGPLLLITAGLAFLALAVSGVVELAAGLAIAIARAGAAGGGVGGGVAPCAAGGP